MLRVNSASYGEFAGKSPGLERNCRAGVFRKLPCRRTAVSVPVDVAHRVGDKRYQAVCIARRPGSSLVGREAIVRAEAVGFLQQVDMESLVALAHEKRFRSSCTGLPETFFVA